MLIGSMTVFGTIGVFRRWLPLPSALIAFFRGLIGTVCILLFLCLRGRKPSGTVGRRAFWLLALTGVLIGFNWILLFEAYNYTTVSVATLCYYMQPTFVVVLAAVLFRERLTLKKSVCSLLALVGMVLVSGVTENGLPRGAAGKGILLGLGAAVLYASVVLLNKRLSGIDPYEKTAIQLGAAAVALIPYLLLTGAFRDNAWSLSTVLLLLVVGVVHTGVAYVLYFGSMDGLKTQTVALFSYIDPVVALVLSAVLLGERMSVWGVLGAVLILGSAILCEWRE